MRQFDVFRTRGAILAALLAIGFSGIGCRGGGMPGGAIETFESGRSALDKGEFAAARVHFSRILDQYPTLVEALIARGECNEREALPLAADSDRRRELLVAAAADYGLASAPQHALERRMQAMMAQGECLSLLGHRTEAIEVFSAAAQEPAAEAAQLFLAHLRAGELLLEILHANMAPDVEFAASDAAYLLEVRAARARFGEALVLQPGDPRARLGLGQCLVHEGLHQEAEQVLDGLTALEPFNSMLAVYLRGVARERRLGPNERSSAEYVEALRLDSEQSFSPLYDRLYRVMQMPNPYSNSEIVELERQLIKYRGDDQNIWLAAQTYFQSLTTRMGHQHLAWAVTCARLGRADDALQAFIEWHFERPEFGDDPTSLELVFGKSNNTWSAEMALARSLAYETMLGDSHTEAREFAWADLRPFVDELKTSGSLGAEALLARICAHLATSQLAYARTQADQAREQLLEETERLTLIEKRILHDAAFAAEFRLGEVEQLRRGGEYPIEFALRAASQDASMRFLPAFQVLERALNDMSQEQLADTDERAVLKKRIESALLAYQGPDAGILGVQARLQEQRLAHQAQLDAAKKQRDAEAKLRSPCDDCGFRASKSQRICPSCGSPLTLQQ
ncbi:MAG: tetratricopeptide repeat protein [Planctomycetota bacterium]